MELIFEPKTERELELIKIIKTNPNKSARKKALQELLVMNGFDKSELYAIRATEVYSRIPNKPLTWKKFYSATVLYENSMLKR